MMLNGIVPVAEAPAVVELESNVVVPSAEAEPKLTLAPAVTVAVSNPVLAEVNGFP
jgi:hypothetical protein